jgi:uncharacterized damage-inducible protein DinB
MSETTRISALFESSFAGQPYYGPSLLSVLEHVAVHLAAKPQTPAHSIWELVAHITAEMDYTSEAIEGTAGAWVEGQTTWPKLADTSEAAWQQMIADLRHAYRRLTNLITTLDDEALRRTAAPIDRSIYVLLHGVLQHNVYHTGQISLMLNPIER